MQNGEMQSVANVFTVSREAIKYLVFNIKYCFYDIFECPCDWNGFKY